CLYAGIDRGVDGRRGCHLILFAGLPAYVPGAVISATIVAPAPMRQPAQTRIPWITVVPAPTMLLSPIVTPPLSTTPGATCTLSPIRQSCSTVLLVFRMHALPILAP